MLEIEIAVNHAPFEVDEPRLRQAVMSILSAAKISRATVSVAIVDDATITRVHDEFMNLPEPTDVLSFILEAGDGFLEGEVVASSDTAARTAKRLGWPPGDELLLYVVHGALHLVGYDDLEPAAVANMRGRERDVLAEFGLTPPRDESSK